ncbi:MAG TPA: hypothetical protein DCE44_05380 [Verrucomicrobiales bacterium]|nr:hypothetical protein [Verrucomicrobiales bacterium]
MGEVCGGRAGQCQDEIVKLVYLVGEGELTSGEGATRTQSYHGHESPAARNGEQITCTALQVVQSHRLLFT